MKLKPQKIVPFILAGIIVLSLLAFVSLGAQQQESGAELQPEKEDTQEVIKPAPKDIKEAVGIYVFLTWMWISIFVLLYILRLKIKEVDRIYRLKFFSSDKS